MSILVLWGSRTPIFWDGVVVGGFWGLHKIVLYNIVYKKNDEKTFQSDDFSEIERFVYIK